MLDNIWGLHGGFLRTMNRNGCRVVMIFWRKSRYEWRAAFQNQNLVPSIELVVSRDEVLSPRDPEIATSLDSVEPEGSIEGILTWAGIGLGRDNGARIS